MAIDTTIYVRSSGVTSALLDWLQMLTGAGLILFMWSHMVLVASVNLGAGAMNTLARFFEITYMAQVGGRSSARPSFFTLSWPRARSLSGWNNKLLSGNTPECYTTMIHGSG